MLELSPQAADLIRTYERPGRDDAGGGVKLRVVPRAEGRVGLLLAAEAEDDDVVSVSHGISLCVDRLAADRVGNMVLDVRAAPDGHAFFFRAPEP